MPLAFTSGRILTNTRVATGPQVAAGKARKRATPRLPRQTRSVEFRSAMTKNHCPKDPALPLPMTLKRRVLFSIDLLLVCLVVGIAAIGAVSAGSSSPQDANERASLLGTGLGVLVGIGWAGLWLPYAAALGKKRRQDQQRAARKSQKRR